MDITVDSTLIGPLVAYAMNNIDTEGGCCPRCCAPCWALGKLLVNGQLDTAVAAYAANTSDGGKWTWWDGDRVDRGWLTNAWRRTDCHEPMAHHGNGDA
jgi:hypothetical protein